ncbi:S8 family serine peptidase [Paenibacillus nuruki]|uniref:S8 family serine peptidase n=1 Tax=Paenibacillus nuruki TaxID=1886670 RepID=UPI002804A1B6|nr:S8 family serine peptidase [Paenibacillus nuruki]CAJ1316232.1 Major intracellular serine protease [Paenibacillus nuruki]
MNKVKAMRTCSMITLTALLTVSTLLSPNRSFAAEEGTITSPYELTSTANASLLHSSANTAPIISRHINLKSSQIIRVIVQLNNEPVAVGRYEADQAVQGFTTQSIEDSQVMASTATTIDSQQSTFTNAAKAKGIKMTVNYRYNTVLNGMELSIPANQISTLAEIPGIKSIYENNNYYTIPVQEPATLTATSATYDASPLNLIGAPMAWQKGLTGKGVKVGVIDTGIDYEHPDLKGAYKGGYDSVHHDNDPYEDPPLSVQDDPQGLGFAGTSHGTHVSGTIVGQAANKTSEIAQKGVAYDAELHVYKVLGRDSQTGRSTGTTAQIIDGIEHAVKDGMDVINLSLGTDADKDVNSPDVIAINNAVLSGVVVVVANGNAAAPGSYYYSLGSPATSPLAISVGASTVPGTQYQASVTASVYDADSVSQDTYAQSYPLQAIAWRTQQDDFAQYLGDTLYQGVYVGLGLDDDYKGKDVQNKVVLISRGGSKFTDKITLAKSKGAKAVIIFNGDAQINDSTQADLSEHIAGRDGNIGSGAYIGDGYPYIPSFDMAGEAGRALARKAIQSPTTPLTFTFGKQYPKTSSIGDTIADFSSRGPNQDGLLGIKPDFVAPGTNIESTFPAYGKLIKDASYKEAYLRQNGTSMASPHVAGLAALLKQEHPDWTPFDIRAILANTAKPLKDEKGTLYDVYSQGSGRVNVIDAVYSPAVLETVEPITILDKELKKKTVTNYGSSAAFGVVAAGGVEQSKTLQIKNTSTTSIQYQATVHMNPSVTSDPYQPVATPDVSHIAARLKGVNPDGSILVSGQSTKSFALAVQPDTTAVTGEYEGDVVLTANGYPTLHLPFVLHVGTNLPDAGLGLQEVTLSDRDIRLDGKKDAIDIGFHLTATDSNVMELNVYDMNDVAQGTLAQVVQPVTDEGYPLFKPGYYNFNDIDNVVMVSDNNGTSLKALPPGQYKLELAVYHVNPQGVTDPNSVHPAYTSYRITGTEKDRIHTAAKPFHYILDGQNKIGKPMIALNDTERITYKVLSTNDAKYVDNTGTLLKYPASGSRIVKLNIQIRSVADPTVQTTVKALVKIKAPAK